MSTQLAGTQDLVQDETIQELSLLGGPLHLLGCRLGLVREGTNTVGLGLALGLLPWTVLILLALLQGYRAEILSLAIIAVHVRFLVAVPMFFLCETCVVPQMAEFARYIVHSGLVPANSLPALASDIRRVRLMSDSWLAEFLLLVAAYMMPMLETVAPLTGRTGSWVSVLQSAGGELSWMAAWYLGFCLPLFRFLIIRWLWRLGLWWYFLWRVQKLELRLVPTHSDNAAGLGYLELVHDNFSLLAFAFSALFSAQFAEEIATGGMAFEALYAYVPIIVILMLALAIGPLFIFYPKLWICRWTGLSTYMGMASRYVNAFDRKWIQTDRSGESQLGSADVQTLADLSTCLNVVRGMRPIPAGRRLATDITVCVLLAMLPLLLLKFPVSQLAEQLFHLLTHM
jgi:hypothetical protein